ncbi:MAG: hypothetical protein IH624_18140 [Phycisphaerae bacterium]|nr:hypothetical protein [Phycisphaerae bacterium]
MNTREKFFAAGLLTGMVILMAAGILAFFEERRLLEMQRIAEIEALSEQLLDDYATHLRDLRREGFNFILLSDERRLDNFNLAASKIEEIGESLRGRPDVFGDKARLDAIIANVRTYVILYRQLIETAVTDGSEVALRQAGETISAARLDHILESLRDLEQENIVAFADRSAEISKAARTTILAIGFFIILAMALIVVSVGVMLHYYVANKSLLRETTALNQNLQASRKEIESIVSFVSHDLRAPLINVNGFSAAIADDNHRLVELLDPLEAAPAARKELDAILRERTPEALNFIKNAAASMETLITTMVKVARAGQLPVHPRRIDVNEMLQGIVSTFEFRIKEVGATVQIDPLPDCTADADQVRQVFSNLLDNAIKYRAPSRALLVRVTGKIDAGQSIYCVEDNGVGIAEADIRNVSEMFYQVKNMSAGGEGMGLAIARKMVERNGGALEVQSELEHGSRFIVRLNAAD